jgi:hypothetical protein
MTQQNHSQHELDTIYAAVQSGTYSGDLALHPELYQGKTVEFLKVLTEDGTGAEVYVRVKGGSSGGWETVPGLYDRPMAD